MSATLNAGSFRLDDTLYGVSRTLKSYLRSILMHKHGIRLIPKSVKPGSCLTPPCNRKLGRRVRNVARIFPNGKWPPRHRLADDAVSCEPVSAPNSPLTGK